MHAPAAPSPRHLLYGRVARVRRVEDRMPGSLAGPVRDDPFASGHPGRRGGRDGESYRREDVSRKRVMTSFGAIEYERPRYRRKGRPSLFPVDRRAGLIESF